MAMDAMRHRETRASKHRIDGDRVDVSILWIDRSAGNNRQDTRRSDDDHSDDDDR